MTFFIKEWQDKSASLMTTNGYVLWTFESLDAARKVCQEWYQVSDDNVLVTGPLSQDLGCSTCSI